MRHIYYATYIYSISSVTQRFALWALDEQSLTPGGTNLENVLFAIDSVLVVLGSAMDDYLIGVFV